MPKRGQTQPYKLRYQYSGQKPRTIAYSGADDAEREIVGMLERGAEVELFYKRGDGGMNRVGSYGPDVEHTARYFDEYRRAWVCSCGRSGPVRSWEKTPGADHVERFTPQDPEADCG
jgi:hypothetical protein